MLRCLFNDIVNGNPAVKRPSPLFVCHPPHSSTERRRAPGCIAQARCHRCSVAAVGGGCAAETPDGVCMHTEPQKLCAVQVRYKNIQLKALLHSFFILYKHFQDTSHCYTHKKGGMMFRRPLFMPKEVYSLIIYDMNICMYIAIYSTTFNIFFAELIVLLINIKPLMTAGYIFSVFSVSF